MRFSVSAEFFCGFAVLDDFFSSVLRFLIYLNAPLLQDIYTLPRVLSQGAVVKYFVGYSVGCLWHSHGKNPVRLYPKLQSQPIGLPKIFIDYLFFQADQSDCTKSVSIFNRFASPEER